jgi:hypothetical protein
MQEWLQKQISTGFADFAGLAIAGKVPIKEDLINELLTAFLKDIPSPSPNAGTDFKPLLRFIKKASVRADAGVITLDFEIAV